MIPTAVRALMGEQCPGCKKVLKAGAYALRLESPSARPTYWHEYCAQRLHQDLGQAIASLEVHTARQEIWSPERGWHRFTVKEPKK